jgi:hypothetical protein
MLKKNNEVIDTWVGLKIEPKFGVGEYELIVSHPDYRPQTIPFQVKRGEEKEVNINLEPRPDAEKLERFGGISNAGKALIFPGWGWSSVTGGEKKGTWIAVSSLALLGTAVLSEMQSKAKYNAYQKEPDITKATNLYDSANQFRQTALGLSAAGLGIWMYNVVKVAIKGASNDALKRKLKQEETLSLELNSAGNGFALTLKF